MELPRLESAEAHQHGLGGAVKFNQSLFDAKFNMKGNVATKLWGLADSPLHDLCVTCVTFHPSNGPEYIIPADMSSRVVFQPTGREDFIEQAITQGSSTEALAFSVKWISKGIKSQPDKNTFVWKLLDQLEKAVGATGAPEPDPSKASFKNLLWASSMLTRFRWRQWRMTTC